jgi:hypothetical protein
LAQELASSVFNCLLYSKLHLAFIRLGWYLNRQAKLFLHINQCAGPLQPRIQSVFNHLLYCL